MRKPVKAKTENTALGYVIFAPQTGIAGNCRVGPGLAARREDKFRVHAGRSAEAVRLWSHRAQFKSNCPDVPYVYAFWVVPLSTGVNKLLHLRQIWASPCPFPKRAPSKVIHIWRFPCPNQKQPVTMVACYARNIDDVPESGKTCAMTVLLAGTPPGN